MKKHNELLIYGIPDSVDETVAAVCRSRLLKAVDDLLVESNIKDLKVIVSNSSKINEIQIPERVDKSSSNDEMTVEERARQYKSEKPFYNFDFLIVPEQLREELLSAIDLIRLEKQVFDDWNLRSIEPFPRTALNFHGLPGTGKTLAAHALAQKVGRPIMVASYAQIESKYHGDGPKNVEALFFAAERDNAVLFIDEADSLLSKRLTNVTQGSEQAINSMRSQLLICLGQFQGIVIFATNLVENYDDAFETRVRSIYFPLPDEKCRIKIWQKHLPTELPLAKSVDVEELAKIDNVCGRDIKNAVIDAAIRTAREEKPCVDISEIFNAIDRIKSSRTKPLFSSQPLKDSEKGQIAEQIRQTLLEDEANKETISY